MSIPLVDLGSMHAELHQQIEEAWRRTRSSDQFIGGRAVEDFETQWAKYCGTRYCIGVSSGTAALELTLAALKIGPGDEVVVPTCTFIATAAAVASLGAQPVFVDVAPATLLMTAESLKEAITSRTAAVIVVHLYGQPANMDAINKVAADAGIYVIEDAAQAHGASWDGKKAGSLSHAGCFSFYPAKNLGAFGDAGAVVTDDAGLASRIRAASNHGRREDDQYRHDVVGTNGRLDALQAAILSVKLARLDEWNEQRRSAMEAYATALAEAPVEFIAISPRARSAYHLAVIQTPHRAEVRRALTDENIATGIHYPIPCHLQAPFVNTGNPRLPVAERATERILSLPLFPHLTCEQIRRIADVTCRTLLDCQPELGRVA